MEVKDYLVGDMRDPDRYIAMMSRGGLSKMPPLIITCAITGDYMDRRRILLYLR
ncbi:MAG: hypothetical protein LUC32_05965 [Clostridiales bacterium]|nr:hypothetical protein [Clostridiales bacterium]